MPTIRAWVEKLHGCVVIAAKREQALSDCDVIGHTDINVCAHIHLYKPTKLARFVQIVHRHGVSDILIGPGPCKQFQELTFTGKPMQAQRLTGLYVNSTLHTHTQGGTSWSNCGHAMERERRSPAATDRE
jgi:hypothetical protein